VASENGNLGISVYIYKLNKKGNNPVNFCSV